MTTKVTRNRLGNVDNKYQGHFKKVLCVCSAGILRSPTLAVILAAEPFNFNTRAVGTDEEFALVPMDAAHVAWADEIVVMDLHQKAVVENTQAELEDMNRGFHLYTPTPIHVANIPDNYGYRDPELIRLLTEWSYEIFITR